jgi:hypothetical protein
LVASGGATGINGDEADSSSDSAGAVYVFTRDGAASNTLAVSALSEDSDATGLNGDQASNVADSAGAVYLY